MKRALILALILLLVCAPSAGAMIISQVQVADKKVALTFDDGPGKYNAQILDLLDKYNAKATFFVIGRHAAINPAGVREMVYRGHEVANHSYNHLIDQWQDSAAMCNDFEHTQAFLYGITGKYPVCYRPPGGDITSQAEQYMEAKGIKIVKWSIDTKDWRKTATTAQIEPIIISNIRNGSIILMHDSPGSNGATYRSLIDLLPRLKAEGYEFVTVSELIGSGDTAVQSPAKEAPQTGQGTDNLAPNDDNGQSVISPGSGEPIIAGGQAQLATNQTGKNKTANGQYVLLSELTNYLRSCFVKLVHGLMVAFV
ncbi:MAG: polysaccharide deacetylase family protein [Candidatus Saccharibacteria bacterium]